jgi:YD repeat-containing protein
MSLKIRSMPMTFLVLTLLISITASSSSAETVSYTYDGLNRLEQVQYPDGTIIRYSYDNVGNRLEKRIFNIDLAVTGISGPPDAHVSQAVTVTTTARNQGGSASGPFYVGIYLSADSAITINDRLLGYAYVGGLGSGAEVNQDTSVTIPADTVTGPYFLGAVADYTGTLLESNEANNALAGNPITIRLPILAIVKTGTGSGTVATVPANLSCGTTCSGYYFLGSGVTLTATPSAGSLFAGWSGGGCSGLDNCNEVVEGDINITATFNMIPPIANFTASPTSGVTPLGVTFTDQSTWTPSSWQWDFGDGATSTLQNPVHTYNNSGDYTVTLTASNAGGSDVKVLSNYIHVVPGGACRISGAPPVYYQTLQAAYDAAVDNSVIQCRGESTAESLNMNRDIAVTLEGGYNSDFTSQTGNTTLHGSITAGSGTATIENFILDQ